MASGEQTVHGAVAKLLGLRALTHMALQVQENGSDIGGMPMDTVIGYRRIRGYCCRDSLIEKLRQTNDSIIRGDTQSF